jgi:hypothetical protein
VRIERNHGVSAAHILHKLLLDAQRHWGDVTDAGAANLRW